mmetsp:Transcript_16115/g.35407  ORF Transcript_16115/g.35407 Transcript_16115/m.35407 type:complete len:258 (+) Transcript_16115:638-1411(+)
MILQYGNIIVPQSQLVLRVDEEVIGAPRVIKIMANRSHEEPQLVNKVEVSVHVRHVQLVVTHLKDGEAVKPVVERIVSVEHLRCRGPILKLFTANSTELSTSGTVYQVHHQFDELLGAVLQSIELERFQRLGLALFLRRHQQGGVQTYVRRSLGRMFIFFSWKMARSTVSFWTPRIRAAAAAAAAGSAIRDMHGSGCRDGCRHARRRFAPSYVMFGDHRLRQVISIGAAPLQCLPSLAIEGVADHHPNLLQLRRVLL